MVANPEGPKNSGDEYWKVMWPEKVTGIDDVSWKRNKDIVKRFMQLGVVTKWEQGTRGKDTYISMPREYLIDGITIEFLPHWTYYKVEGRRLKLPTSMDQFREDLRVFRYLQSRTASI